MTTVEEKRNYIKNGGVIDTSTGRPLKVAGEVTLANTASPADDKKDIIRHNVAMSLGSKSRKMVDSQSSDEVYPSPKKISKYPKYVEPTAGRLVAVPFDSGESKTASGILIAVQGEAKQQPQIMVITHIGADTKQYWQEDDVIAVPKYAGVKVTIDNIEFTILDEEEVLGRVRGLESNEKAD